MRDLKYGKTSRFHKPKTFGIKKIIGKFKVKLNSIKISSQVWWLIEGEKPSSYFVHLKNLLYRKNCSKVMAADGNVITEQKN